MSADVDTAGWLAERGYDLADARQKAFDALVAAGLTRAGKTRLSVEKLPKAEAALEAQFFVHCTQAECLGRAKASGKTPVVTTAKAQCKSCGGSDNRRAADELVEVFRQRGWARLVIVGGSPSVREELERALAHRLQLRVIDGTERRPSERAKADLDWADLVLVWSASELHHKVSLQYTQATGEARKKLVACHRRGIGPMLAEAIAHAQKA